MKRNLDKLYIIKIGGNILDDEHKLHAFLKNLVSVRGKKILVHGGGKLASSMSLKLGIEPQMHNGRRITDLETVRMVTMVYAGWINKSIVAELNALGVHAIGLSGADAQLIPAEKRPVREIDYGYAGDILQEKINGKFLVQLLESGFLPVIAPITADAKGQLLNTNADTIASALAVALAAQYEVNLIYCFEKKGVLLDVSDDDSVISDLDKKRFAELKSQGVIDKGMLPKLENAFDALDNGVHRVLIGHADDIVSLTSQNQHEGTLIRR
jgi:acetylglutamate kinase